MADTRKLRWGYIDTTGSVVIDFHFDHASQFHEGLGLVRISGKSGYINKSGDTVIEPQFGDESQPFFEGLAMVQAATGKCGFIDQRGHYAIESIYDWAQPFSEGIALVRVAGSYGYVIKNGEYLVRPRYDHAESYSEGYASVSKGESWYYLNKSGEIVFGPFGSTGDFSEGVARVWHEEGDALLRSDGTVVPVLGYERDSTPSGGRGANCPTKPTARPPSPWHLVCAPRRYGTLRPASMEHNSRRCWLTPVTRALAD